MVEMGFLYGATLIAHTDGCLLVVTDVTGLDVVTEALWALAVITVLITDTGLHFSCCRTWSSVEEGCCTVATTAAPTLGAGA